MASTNKKSVKESAFSDENGKRRKDTNGFCNEISNFDELRKILRLVYMYGTYSKLDMVGLNVAKISSDRMMHNYLKRIENYVNSGEYDEGGHLESAYIPGRKTDKKRERIIIDPFKNTFNFLSAAFHQHTISANDILVYFYLLNLYAASKHNPEVFQGYKGESEFVKQYGEASLNYCIGTDKVDFENGFSASGFQDAFERLYAHTGSIAEFGSNSIPSDALNMSLDIITAKLDEFVELGILGKGDCPEKPYIVTGDFFGKLASDFADNVISQEILTDLQELIAFYQNYACVTIPGHYLLEKLNQMDVVTNNDSVLESDVFRLSGKGHPFLFERTRFQNLIDDDITWQLFEAIHKQSVVTFTYQQGSQETAHKCTILPIKVIEDSQYGRHYVWGWDYKVPRQARGKHFELYRIDRIYDLATDETEMDFSRKYVFLNCDKTATSNTVPYAVLDELYQKTMEHVWNVTAPINDQKKVAIFFNFDKSPEGQRLLDYAVKSKRHGIFDVSAKEGFTHSVTFENTDPNELIPWINIFGSHAQIDKETNPEFYELYKQYTLEQVKQYDTI